MSNVETEVKEMKLEEHIEIGNVPFMVMLGDTKKGVGQTEVRRMLTDFSREAVKAMELSDSNLVTYTDKNSLLVYLYPDLIKNTKAVDDFELPLVIGDLTASNEDGLYTVMEIGLNCGFPGSETWEPAIFRNQFMLGIQRLVTDVLYDNSIVTELCEDDEESITWKRVKSEKVNKSLTVYKDFHVTFVIDDGRFPKTAHGKLIREFIGMAIEAAGELTAMEHVPAEVLRIKDIDRTISYASELKEMKRKKKKDKKNKKKHK